MAGIDINIYVHELNETLTEANPPGDLTTFDMFGSGTLNSGDLLPDGSAAADPVVYNNGVVVGSGNYSITKSTGVVVFGAPQGATDVITCDYTWLIAAADIRDVMTYEFDKAINRVTEPDIAARPMTTEAEELNMPWVGRIEWQYLKAAQYVLIYHLGTTTALTFDLERIAMDTSLPVQVIMNMIVDGSVPYRPSGAADNCTDIAYTIREIPS